MSDISLERIDKNRGDVVHNPSHYIRGGTECRFVTRAMMDGVSEYTDEEGNRHPIPLSAAGWWQQASQYLWRWCDKGGIKDLEKAKEAINIMIEELMVAQ